MKNDNVKYARNFYGDYRVIAFILAFKDRPIKVLSCLSRQTVKPEKTIIVAAYSSACVESYQGLSISCEIIPPDLSLTIGERVGISLTIAFKKHRIEKYDFVIKLDDDVSFDEHFIEENIKAGYDVMGRGSGMIIKTLCFVKCFNHEWPISPIDDVCVVATLKAKGYEVLEWNWIKKAKVSKEPIYNVRRAFISGLWLYKLGIPFISVTLDSFFVFIKRYCEPKNAIARICGFIAGFIFRAAEYKNARDIKRYYIQQIRKGIINRIGKFARLCLI